MSDNESLDEVESMRLLMQDKINLIVELVDPKVSDDRKCDIYNEMAVDKNWRMRSYVAASKLPEKCACDIFNKLKNDHEHLDESELEDHPYYEGRVRSNLAGNLNIPKGCACEIFNKLVYDDDPFYISGIVHDNSIWKNYCKSGLYLDTIPENEANDQKKFDEAKMEGMVYKKLNKGELLSKDDLTALQKVGLL